MVSASTATSDESFHVYVYIITDMRGAYVCAAVINIEQKAYQSCL